MTTPENPKEMPVETELRIEDALRYTEAALRRYEASNADLRERLRAAEQGVLRERFIRIMAMQLGQELLPVPAKFDLNEKGAVDECWRRAKALWDAKPEDC